MLHSHYPYGKKKGGYIMRIPEDGFNGIADIIWAEDARMMKDRSEDGKQ